MRIRTKILAVIPARGGSRGIPKKNIRKFCGRPLIYYTITAAKNARIFDRIMVSTDSPDIMRVSKNLGAEVPFLRPKKLATGSSNVVDAVLHLLDNLRRRENYVPDYIFLLQPTSPLRSSEDIINSWKFYCQHKAKALVSICQTHHQIFSLKHRRLKLINKESRALVNRQEQEPTYRQDGSMIYIIETKYFLAKKNFTPSEALGYIVPKWKSVDIDEMEDFILAGILYRNRNYFKRFGL